MDAAPIIERARGVLFHLEAAHLELTARGADAAALRAPALQHLAHASTEAPEALALAREHGLPSGVVDALAASAAVTGALHASPTPDVTLVRAAADQAHAALRDLTAFAPDPHALTRRSLATALPDAERLAVTDARTARDLRATVPTLRRDVIDTLATGAHRDDSWSVIPAAGNNFNGDVARVTVIDPRNAAHEIATISKPANAQAAQEMLYMSLARRLGVDHLVSEAARRSDGSLSAQFVSGVPFWKGNVHSAGDIDRVLTDQYQAVFPTLDRATAGRAARTDRQLLQTLDWLVANNDRHMGNGIVDAQAGTLYLIDHGFSGRGETADALVPELKATYQGWDGVRQLDPDALAVIRERLTPGDIAAAHAELTAPAGAVTDPAALHRLAEDRSSDFLTRMLRRLDHVQTTGEYRWQPIEDTAHPLTPRGRPPRVTQ